MHKLTKPLLHLYLSLASVAAFAIGWVFLAHSPKPAPLLPSQPQSQVQVSTFVQPTLEPVPSLNDYLKNGNGNVTSSLPVFQSPSITFPRLRTRGS